MSKLEVNAVEPQCGTNLTLGASGDTIIIPSGATISNQGTAAGFGPTGAVSWDTTKKTTGFTAVSGVGYFCDTTSAAFTVTLPSSPSAGAVIGITDYANTFATNNVTVGRNSSNIGGAANNAVLSTNGIAVTFVYVDATQGWIVTDSGNRSDLPTPTFITATGGTILTCGNFKSHVFTGPGTFTVCSVGNPSGSNSIEYIVVAGGGGGGVGNCNSQGDGGGGGAGGYRQNYPSPTTAGLPVTAQAYPITVGAGGGGAPNACAKGGNGNNSIFSTITSTGGGGGGSRNTCWQLGASGGSGGGGGQSDPGNPFYPPTGPSGGTGNSPPVSPPQGNPGGSGFITSPSTGGGGGGGGAGGAGGNSPGATVGGLGGIGSPIATTVFGPTAPSYGTPGPAPGRYFAGGGGGAGNPPSSGGTGGAGGGGQGGVSVSQTAGTVNTGGGGGAGGAPAGGGGSGIVIIRYRYQ
jgi:hypothetical protein